MELDWPKLYGLLVDRFELSVGVVDRQYGNQETAVSIEDRGGVAFLNYALLADHEVRHLLTVCARREVLLDVDVAGIVQVRQVSDGSHFVVLVYVIKSRWQY